MRAWRVGDSVVLLAVFLSGASALVFETLLFRLAGLALGNGVRAVSIVLCSFMAGLAIGNAWMSSRGDRLRAPLRAYVAIELVIGASGLLALVLLRELPSLSSLLFRAVPARDFLLAGLQLGLAFVVMCAPAIAMGMTLPVLVASLTRHRSDFGRVLGGVYGWNTLGAVVGALATERILVTSFGVAGAGVAAATLNLCAAGLAFVVMRGRVREASAPHDETAEAAPPRSSGRPARRLLVAAFLFGGVLLACEVVWFRFFLLFLPAYDWNLAAMLAIVLLGIALGGLAGAAWFRVRPAADAHVSSLALCAGALTAGLYASLPVLASSGQPNLLAMQVLLMLPVSMISGMLFTLTTRAFERSAAGASYATGQVTWVNTVGAAAGSVLGGFVLIPRLGVEGSLFLLAGLYGVGALIAYPPAIPAKRGWVVGAGLVWLVSLYAFPFGAMESSLLGMKGGPRRTLEEDGFVRLLYREGLTETIQYYAKMLGGRPEFYKLITNSHTMSDTSFRARRYMKMYVYWPVAVHPALEDVLLISYGVGSTAKALVDTPSVRSIDVVDISREILEASSIVHPGDENPLHDPRVSVHVEDGRFFLLTTPREYDLITAEPPPPKASGVVNLYSREYFELVADRLREGGIVTYWLPVYQLDLDESKAITRAFCDVFPNCSLWTGKVLEWMLVGIQGEPHTPTSAHFRRQWEDPQVGPEMRRLGFQSAAQFGSLFIADGERLASWIGDTPPLVDDHPQRLRSYEASGDATRSYFIFMNDPGAARNFAESALIERIWPKELRDAAAAYFPVRGFLNQLLTLQRDPRLFHQVLTNPLLDGYALWALSSDADAQRAIEPFWNASPEQEGLEPAIYGHLAARALERGDAALSARFLAAMASACRRQAQPPPDWLFQARLYLHLRAGDATAAAALRDEAVRAARSRAERERVRRLWTEARRAAASRG